MDTTSTIIAVSTPPGASARAMVRLSGPDTRRVIESIMLGASWRSGTWTDRLTLGHSALPVLISAYETPNSYTGQDIAEVQAPGNGLVLNRIIEACLEIGTRRSLDVRRAEPGEFTARAFLNGRLTLLEAEAVAITIAAQSDAELRASAMLREGGLGEFARDVADNLADALALVEAGIDFTDQEDVVPIGPTELASLLRALLAGIDEVLEHAVGMEVIQDIPWVVLAGEANAGKSTLFNALLGHERAVVSPVAGTTRDVISEPLSIPTEAGDIEVILVDVAGADTTDDSRLARDMQRAAEAARQRAQLIVECIPADSPNVTNGQTTAMIVRTKCDLRIEPASALNVSALTGTGLDRLRSAIADRLHHRTVVMPPDTVALQHRHEAALRDAGDAMRAALDALGSKPGATIEHVELVAASMRSALDALQSLVGALTPDDVLGRIFASFCVGK